MIPSHADYLKEIIENTETRINKRKERINTTSCFKMLINEKRNAIQLGLYLVIKAGYTISVSYHKDGTIKYRINEIQEILDRSLVHENTKTLKVLFNNDSNTVGIPVLFRLCLALCLTFEESYDWFMACGYNLSADIGEWPCITHLLYIYTTKNNEYVSLSNVVKNIYDASDYSVRHGFRKLCPPEKKTERGN